MSCQATVHAGLLGIRPVQYCRQRMSFPAIQLEQVLQRYYLIACRRCGQQYVGETGQPLHRRINSHRFDIVHWRTDESPVTEHFNSDAHLQADMVVMIIDQIQSHDPCLQKIRESRWIRTLGTSHPLRMNLRVDSL